LLLDFVHCILVNLSWKKNFNHIFQRRKIELIVLKFKIVVRFCFRFNFTTGYKLSNFILRRKGVLFDIFNWILIKSWYGFLNWCIFLFFLGCNGKIIFSSIMKWFNIAIWLGFVYSFYLSISSFSLNFPNKWIFPWKSLQADILIWKSQLFKKDFFCLVAYCFQNLLKQRHSKRLQQIHLVWKSIKGRDGFSVLPWQNTFDCDLLPSSRRHSEWFKSAPNDRGWVVWTSPYKIPIEKG
jgi:hypothetical protein